MTRRRQVALDERQTVRIYGASYKLLGWTRHMMLSAFSGLRSCWAGFWLGILDRATLSAVAAAYYSEHPRYLDGDYNRSGLWRWEQQALADYFPANARLLLIAAGGGREVLALTRLGHDVMAVECNPDLVRVANALLAEEGLAATVYHAPPDTCPSTSIVFGGLIVGWGAYMLVQGRANRIALLESMRSQVQPGAPLLVSFFSRSAHEKRFHLTAAIANALRRIRGRDLLEVGDDLEPECVHYFTRDELSHELHDAGFTLESYREQPYAHAVARATARA
jgi:hypothetical protein